MATLRTCVGDCAFTHCLLQLTPFLCYRSSVTYSSHSYTHSVVAATAETKKFAESNNYGVYAPVETFEAVAGAKYNHLYLSPM